MTSDATVPPPAISQADAETRLLLSADENGRIPFPEGNSRQVAVFLRALSRLDESGHIQHLLQNGYLACYLTDSGKQLKSQAMTAQVDGRRDPAQASHWDQARRGMFLLALAAALLASAPRAHARLGETPDRLAARYGAPVKCENGVCGRDFQYTYKHDGFVIVVHFLDEKSQYERYANENGEPLPAELMQNLMEINGRGGKWSAKKDTGSSKEWSLSSGDVFASEVNDNGHWLELKTSWWQHFIGLHSTVAKTGINERLKDF